MSQAQPNAHNRTLPMLPAADPFVDERRASELIGICVGTLQRWRVDGRGPRYRKFGTLVRYGLADLYEWIEAQPSGGGH